ncbi:MAG: type I restriction endonuclease [Paludibacter sp.]
MDFKDLIKQLSERIEKLKGNIETEEATKNAFVMPFLQALGYDVFNPLEIMPEYTCDIGIKKGEKIDYAIFKDGSPIILIECKHCTQNLDLHDGQLLRYFHVSKAKFSILTNGIIYRFYTDLDNKNVMDSKPFLEINLSNISDTEIEQIKQFHKSYFNESSILSIASELRLATDIKSILKREFSTPTPEFVKFFIRETNDGKFASKQIEQYTPILKKSIQSHINEIISDRLNVAIETQNIKPNPIKTELPLGVVAISEDGKIITTQEEIDSYIIIKNILRKEIDISRISYMDYQSYFVILLDNSSKWICRLYFKTSKSISFPAENKTEEKIQLQSIEDIYSISDKIIEVAKKLK